MPALLVALLVVASCLFALVAVLAFTRFVRNEAARVRAAQPAKDA